MLIQYNKLKYILLKHYKNVNIQIAINGIINTTLFLEKAMANDLELKLVFCRLNYPSFYFDLYEKVINQQMDESRLDTVIKRNEEYREFLKNIYYIMNKKTKIKNIEWITK